MPNRKKGKRSETPLASADSIMVHGKVVDLVELARIVCRNFRGRRIEIGLTQKQIAAVLGVDQSFIANIEGAKYYDSFSTKQIVAFAAALGTTVEKLITPGFFVAKPRRGAA